MAKAITDAEFQTEVEQSTVPVVMDFWAPWCGPCKMMNPIVEELSAEYGDRVKFVKMNVDENGEVASKFNVLSIPTFVIFVGGEAKRSFVGARSKEDMKKEIEDAMTAA